MLLSNIDNISCTYSSQSRGHTSSILCTHFRDCTNISNIFSYCAINCLLYLYFSKTNIYNYVIVLGELLEITVIIVGVTKVKKTVVVLIIVMVMIKLI